MEMPLITHIIVVFYKWEVEYGRTASCVSFMYVLNRMLPLSGWFESCVSIALRARSVLHTAVNPIAIF